MAYDLFLVFALFLVTFFNHLFPSHEVMNKKKMDINFLLYILPPTHPSNSSTESYL